jgi:hypothetical protein
MRRAGPRTAVDFPYECDFIISKARAGENFISVIGCLVFLASANEDAYALDLEDRFACPLCLNGEKQPYAPLDAGTRWSFHWPWRYFLAQGLICFERTDGGDPYVAITLDASVVAGELALYNQREGSNFHL